MTPEEAKAVYVNTRQQIAELKKLQDKAAEVLREAAAAGEAPEGVTLRTSRRQVCTDLESLVSACEHFELGFPDTAIRLDCKAFWAAVDEQEPSSATTAVLLQYFGFEETTSLRVCK